SDITWHYHSSMVYAAHCARNAKSGFEKYHNVRSCVYFAIGVLESVLNSEMRSHLTLDGVSESKIKDRMFKTNLQGKIKTWPKELFGTYQQFRDDVCGTISDIQAIRNEVTHPKRRDHSIYSQLDALACIIETVVGHVSIAVVQIAEWKNVPFDYWLTGWNYVGMSGNFTEPSIGNNGNDFVYSLKALGFRHTICDNMPVGEWEHVLMISVEKFEMLKKALDGCPRDIEPFAACASLKPRLCRRWWDRELILGSRSL
ncbi:MAG: hypothetical protein Q7I92_11730, partial [Humidesulfovibrio sp.]|nr:hypothetical protein [Humidesulfovibrio sp.]